MIKYIPVGWTERELIAQLAYERSKSPLIDILCQRFEQYLDKCDVEMITLHIETQHRNKLKDIDEGITTGADCPICGAQLGLHIDSDADTPFTLVPYSEIKQNGDSGQTLSSLVSAPE